MTPSQDEPDDNPEFDSDGGPLERRYDHLQPVELANRAIDFGEGLGRDGRSLSAAARKKALAEYSLLQDRLTHWLDYLAKPRSTQYALLVAAVVLYAGAVKGGIVPAGGVLPPSMAVYRRAVPVPDDGQPEAERQPSATRPVVESQPAADPTALPGEATKNASPVQERSIRRALQNFWQRTRRSHRHPQTESAAPTNNLPPAQWATIYRTDRFISIEPLSGCLQQLREDELFVIYLAPDAAAEDLGRGLHEALGRSRFIIPPDELEFFKEERSRACNLKWEADVMSRFGYETRREALANMDWCWVERSRGKIEIKPYRHHKSDFRKVVPAGQSVVIPATDAAAAVGAALRLALKQCEA